MTSESVIRTAIEKNDMDTLKALIKALEKMIVCRNDIILELDLELAKQKIEGKLLTYEEWTKREEGDDCVMFCVHVKELEAELAKMKAVNKDMKFGEICNNCHQEKSLRNPDCQICAGKIRKPLSRERLEEIIEESIKCESDRAARCFIGGKQRSIYAIMEEME